MGDVLLAVFAAVRSDLEKAAPKTLSVHACDNAGPRGVGCAFTGGTLGRRAVSVRRRRLGPSAA